MMDNLRLTPDERRAVIITAAVDVAKEYGIVRMTLERVAERCNIPTSEATIRRYFHTLTDLRQAVCVADEAVADEARRAGLL